MLNLLIQFGKNNAKIYKKQDLENRGKEIEMKTFEQNYTTVDRDGNYVEETGEFVKVSQIQKRKHQVAIYRKSVDWCQPNYYIVDGIVYKEETHWQRGSLLVGSGVALNTGKSIEHYFGDDFLNYYYLAEAK